MSNQKLFVFDFDGTLVDSYSCLPDIFASIARNTGLQGDAVSKFVNAMIEGEDRNDALRNYNRHTWWPTVFEQLHIYVPQEKLRQLIETHWELRTSRSKVINGGKEILRSLKNWGVLALACADDGQYGNKRRRIEKSGLGAFFDEVVIVGEDTVNLTQTVASLREKHGMDRSEVVVFNDKPYPINEISKNMKDMKTVKIEFEGILKLAWAEECAPTYRIGTIGEVKRFFDWLGKGDQG